MIKEPTLSDAIGALGIQGGWKVKGGKIAKWYSDQPQPSDSAINAKLAELQAEYNAQAYARSRATEYPSIQEQLDLQYWDKVNSTDKWGEAVKAVKDKYPKG